MSIFSFISKQFIDVIQWTDETPGVLAWQYPMQDQEIQNGGQLVVRETQRALFVNEGKGADQFGPGTYTLTTQTLPVLTYLRNWDKFFESPFKSDVFYFSTKEQVDQKWGTAQPITVRDKELGALRIRANGVYAWRIVDATVFFEKLSGVRPSYTIEEAAGQLRAAIMTALATALGSSAVPFLDMAAQQSALSEALKPAIAPAFQAYGLELTQFYLQSLSLPDEVQEVLDKKSSMALVGDMQKYTQFQAAQSLPIAAANPGGVAGAGVGLGAGVALGQALMPGMTQGAAAPAAPAPDPLAVIERLGELFQKGVLTQAEFEAKKAELLRQIG